jgi:glutamate dehydrogenase
VLADNHAQSLAVSLEALNAVENLPAHAALMDRLEAERLLDRAVAGLPDAATLRARVAANEGLLRPEIAALLPFCKLWLSQAIEQGALPDDPALAPLLVAYFPAPLRERFAPLIARHRLRRELVAMSLANLAANRLGIAGLARLAGGAGDPSAVVRAAWLAGELFGIEDAAVAVDATPVPAASRLGALLGLRRLQEGAARELLGVPGALGGVRDFLASGIAPLVGAASAAPTAEAALLAASGIPDRAATLAGTPGLAAAPSIVRLAAEAGIAPVEAATAWAAVGEAFALDALRAAAERARANGPFGARAKAEALADLAALQARLARSRLTGALPDGAAASRLARDAAAAGDLVAIGVATRALGGLG